MSFDFPIPPTDDPVIQFFRTCDDGTLRRLRAWRHMNVPFDLSTSERRALSIDAVVRELEKLGMFEGDRMWDAAEHLAGPVRRIELQQALSRRYRWKESSRPTVVSNPAPVAPQVPRRHPIKTMPQNDQRRMSVQTRAAIRFVQAMGWPHGMAAFRAYCRAAGPLWDSAANHTASGGTVAGIVASLATELVRRSLFKPAQLAKMYLYYPALGSTFEKFAAECGHDFLPYLRSDG